MGDNLMAFTKEQIEKYIESNGTECPYCGGDKIIDTWISGKYLKIIYLIECGQCGNQWEEQRECKITEIKEV